MKIYLNSEFHCSLEEKADTVQCIETDFFDGKCAAFIEGHRLKPAGETWVREDGFVFSGGEMISSWKPYDQLAAAQAQYELDKAESAELEASFQYLMTGGTT